MYCGNENDDTSLTCSKCGNRLLDTPTPSAVETEVQEETAPEEEIASAAEDAAEQIAENAQASAQPLQDAAPGTAGKDMPDFLKNQSQEAADQVETNNFYGQQANDQQNGQQYGGYNQQYSGYDQQYANEPQYSQPQYAARPDAAHENGYPYGYAQNYGAQPEVQQQYGGQAYGYQGQAQQYGFAAQNQAQSAHDYGRTQPPSGGSAGTLMQKARRSVKSPLFFLVVLLHTIMTVASILNLITGNVLYNLNVMQDSLQKTVGNNLAVTYMNSVIDLIEGASKTTILGVDFALCIPGVLVCLGLWLMFLKTTVKKEEISTGGYTLTKVMTLLKFIAVCLVLAAGLIFSVAFVVAAGAGGTAATIIAGIILLVTMILISVLTILFYVQLLHALKVIKWNAKNGTDKGRISTYVPVVGILLSIGTGLSMIPMAPNDYIGLTNQAASAAWMLFGSIWLLVYRAKVVR